MKWDQVSTTLILSHAVSYPNLPYQDADGHHCHVRRAAADVAGAIVRASIPTTPVMHELHRQAQERCKEHAIHGYSSLDSDSKDSVKHLTRVLGTFHVFWTQLGDVSRHNIWLVWFVQVTAATVTRPLPGISSAALSHFSLAWQGICLRHAAPLAGDIGGGVIPLLTRMARDSLKTRRAERQVYRTPFFANMCAYQGG
jgi:hypothetical protein